MVTHEEACARCCQLARIGICKVDDVLQAIEFAIFSDNENSRVCAPVCDRLEAVGAVFNAAFDGLGDEMRDVVSAQRVAIGFGLGREPVPAHASACAGFIENCNRHAERIFVSGSHCHDARLKVRCAASAIADHQHHRTLRVAVVAVRERGSSQSHQAHCEPCYQFSHGVPPIGDICRLCGSEKDLSRCEDFQQ